MIRTASHKRLVAEARARRVVIEGLTATVPDGHGGSRATAGAFEFFHSVVPAASGDRERPWTAYFYRQAAIGWGRMARGRTWFPGQRERYARLAKHYLVRYREMSARSASRPTAMGVRS